ncbi:ROK family protein [Pseudoduganella sp. FT55W]|uniref:ROK family protein n=1 Tax=Duganella rivi TaxID=2666083 RepID=A0A7X4GUQ8_9BURK|nr:ROK family protein [Duganella rivi]MYM70078.1 ROK family protein [Duganella rivi]
MSRPTEYAQWLDRLQLPCVSANGRHVLRLLIKSGCISQAAIVRHSDFSQPTVVRLMQSFLKEGMVVLSSRAAEGPGNPSANVTLNPDYTFSFGIAMLGDVLSLVLMDFIGRVRGVRSAAMPDMSRQAVLDKLVQFKSELLHEVPQATRLAGIGLGISGFFVNQGGMINPPQSLKDWALVDIEPIIEEAMRLPVMLDNDATAAAIGESLFGIGRNSANFAYLHLTNGFGGGIIVNGQPFRGHHGNAGEFGGVWALANADYPNLDLLRACVAEQGHVFATVEDMVQVIDAGWPGVDRWLEQAVQPFSMLAGLLTSIIDPEIIVLGGRLPPSIGTALLERLVIPSPGSRWGQFPPQPRLVLAQVDEHAVAIGAAAMPMQRLFFG